jgi:hypothetical protein
MNEVKPIALDMLEEKMMAFDAAQPILRAYSSRFEPKPLRPDRMCAMRRIADQNQVCTKPRECQHRNRPKDRPVMLGRDFCFAGL